MGRPHLVLLLGQLPAVDRLAGYHVPRHPGHGLWRRVQLGRQDGYRTCLCVDRLPYGPLKGGRLRVGP